MTCTRRTERRIGHSMIIRRCTCPVSILSIISVPVVIPVAYPIQAILGRRRPGSITIPITISVPVSVSIIPTPDRRWAPPLFWSATTTPPVPVPVAVLPDTFSIISTPRRTERARPSPSGTVDGWRRTPIVTPNRRRRTLGPLKEKVQFSIENVQEEILILGCLNGILQSSFHA